MKKARSKNPTQSNQTQKLNEKSRSKKEKISSILQN